MFETALAHESVGVLFDEKTRRKNPFNTLFRGSWSIGPRFFKAVPLQKGVILNI
jgi:hypothetical protein